MKALLVASVVSLAMTSVAFSASITVSDKSPTLAGVAAATTALLLDAGTKPQHIGSGIFVVEVKNFHCDQRSNAAADAMSVRAGLPTLKCRINSQNKRDASGGQPFAEGRAMVDLLQKVQDSKAARAPVPRSPTAPWATAAPSRNRSSAPSTPRSTITAMAADGAAILPTGSDGAYGRLMSSPWAETAAVNPPSTNHRHD
jgi:hypothetical protein